jgi:hypothetical protein
MTLIGLIALSVGLQTPMLGSVLLPHLSCATRPSVHEAKFSNSFHSKYISVSEFSVS